MAKILITGMTSAQSSKSLNDKSLFFSGAMRGILLANGHEVDLRETSVFDNKSDFKEFDSILIGISPVLSVTSNNAYGALAAVNTLKNDKRVLFFIDAPNPARIAANLKAVEKDTSQMTKDFYRFRREYKNVLYSGEVTAKIAEGALLLATQKWPTVVYPAMPWSDDLEVLGQLPVTCKTKAVGINVDSFYVSKDILKISSDKINRWAVDTDKSKWSSSVIETLKFPHVKMKLHHRSDDTSVGEQISKSIGSLISPSEDRSLWWSHRWAQALNLNVPIASEWKITSCLGSSWSHLAAGIEEMSHIDRYELAISQRDEYANFLPSQDTITQTIESTLGI